MAKYFTDHMAIWSYSTSWFAKQLIPNPEDLRLRSNHGQHEGQWFRLYIEGKNKKKQNALNVPSINFLLTVTSWRRDAVHSQSFFTNWQSIANQNHRLFIIDKSVVDVIKLFWGKFRFPIKKKLNKVCSDVWTCTKMSTQCYFQAKLFSKTVYYY